VEDAPISLDERRALDRTNITGQLKDNLNLTTKWPDIITSFCGFTRSTPFMNQSSVDDHIDGFEISTHESYSAKRLHSMLKELGLDVTMPIAKRRRGSFWLKLKSGPYGMTHNLPLLKQATETLATRRLGAEHRAAKANLRSHAEDD